MSSIQRTCSIENCDKEHVAKSLCGMHYERNRIHGDPNIQIEIHEKHGLSKTYISRIWRLIKDRCFNPRNKSYDNYGGRGITICAGWKNSLKTFYHDMGDRPDSNYSIDRIDNDGSYSCGYCNQCIINGWSLNCRWTTRSIQVINQRIKKTNSSGYRGVTWIRNNWLAQIGYTIDGKSKRWWIGSYKTKEEAAIAYDQAAIFLWGDEAKTNIL